MSTHFTGRETSSEKGQGFAHRAGAYKPRPGLGREGFGFVSSQPLVKAEESSARNVSHSQDGGASDAGWDAGLGTQMVSQPF